MRTLRARPEPLTGDEVIGLERLSQIRGRNMLTLGDCMTR